ncbi:6-phosphogluconolactonase [termite gut metagenome]|uniref:6-phosphogluconolactonase n=1 Tax=termite gut metagenome TaxID=433724 RepID=A0A5J4STY3_9ZZZZ
MIKQLSVFFLTGMFVASCLPKKTNSQQTNDGLTLLVGTYTSGASKGIYTFRFNTETGESVPLAETEVSNPSYLTLSADGKFVYAVNEHSDEHAAVFAYAFDKEKGTLRLLETTGILTKVGYQLTGIHPRNFIITPNDKFLLVACRDSNVIQIYERNKETGLLTDSKKDIKSDAPICMKFAD